MAEEQKQGDEGDRRAMRVIFTETGHRTLNALLIVSGGATVTFLTFLGQAAQQTSLAPRIGVTAVRGLADAMEFFFDSLLCAVVAHGTTYASHAGYHESAALVQNPARSRLFRAIGRAFMWATVIVCALSVFFLLRGGFSAIDAFKAVASALTAPTPAVPK
jgi:hypothetical protein